MPKIGWASSTLPTKLGGANSRSMGTPNCGWLPTRTDDNSLPGPCAPSNKVFTREQGPDNHRGSRTTGQRGNLGDTTELCVSNFPGGKKGWGSETCYKPKGSQSICEDRALQDGRPTPTPRSLTATRLDDKDGSEGCLPSDPYSSRPSTPSHLPMGREDLHVSMPTLWSLSSTQGVHKTAETSGRLPETKWLSPHNILRRHATATPGQGPTTTGDPTHLPIIGELGVNGKPEKIHTDTNPGARISGLPSVLSNNETLDSLREIKEDPTGCQASAGSRICVSEGNSKVCGQSYGYHESHPIGPIALQSPPTIDELCPSPELHPGRNINQIRNSSNTDSSQQERLRVVDRPQEGPTWGTSVSPRPNNNDTLGCIQQGLGCSAEWSITDRGLMVSRGGNSPHKLSRVVGSLSSNKSIREGMAECHHSAANGQCYGCKLHQSERRDSLTATVPVSPDNLGLVCREEYNSPSRASARPPEPTGRRGIQDSEGSLRLDAEPIDIPAHKLSDGSAGDGSVCITPDKTTPTLLQLEARSRGGGDRCLHAELGSISGVCQPSVVSDTPLPDQAEKANSTNGVDNTIVEDPTMVPVTSGASRGLASEDTSPTRPSSNASGAGIFDAARSATTGLAYLRQSYSSRGLSPQASDLMLASWRDKTNSNYGSSFSKWSSWCQQRGRDPLSGPIEDVVNFLADLFADGYQYQSLNAYRSAISSTHENVNGVSVGSHPAVTRLLKGAFHSRPPQPRYASFWDVGIVIQHIKKLGPNKDLSLKQLTMKTVMLLALTRPS